MPIADARETCAPTPDTPPALPVRRTDARVAAWILAAAILTTALASTESASATATVSRFSVTPSTIQAGGHPRLRLSIVFSEPTGLRSLALHLPAGLTAQPRAIPFCSRKSLLADFCPRQSKVGSIEAVAVAYGLELPVTREIDNVRPRPTERLRLGVPIVPSYTGTGVAAEIPVTERPGDKGLDMAISGLPGEVGGIPVRLEEIGFSIKGMSRTRIKKRIRTRAFLTNPTSCTAATSVVDVTLQDVPATTLTASSSFTPSDCTSSMPRLP
jgi:hypothetical protein